MNRPRYHMHGLENRRDSQREVLPMEWRDEKGHQHRGLVMGWALKTLGEGDLAPLSQMLAARLEIMQVFYGGPIELGRRLELDVPTLRKLRYRNYHPLTGNVMDRIDYLWDRTYRILRYGQKS